MLLYINAIFVYLKELRVFVWKHSLSPLIKEFWLSNYYFYAANTTYISFSKSMPIFYIKTLAKTHENLM